MVDLVEQAAFVRLIGRFDNGKVDKRTRRLHSQPIVEVVLKSSVHPLLDRIDFNHGGLLMQKSGRVFTYHCKPDIGIWDALGGRRVAGLFIPLHSDTPHYFKLVDSIDKCLFDVLGRS